jgi:hypothetical protein
MKPSRNEHTGDFLITGANSDAYKSGWDLIWGSKKKVEEVQPAEVDKEVDDTSNS